MDESMEHFYVLQGDNRVAPDVEVTAWDEQYDIRCDKRATDSRSIERMPSRAQLLRTYADPMDLLWDFHCNIYVSEQLLQALNQEQALRAVTSLEVVIEGTASRQRWYVIRPDIVSVSPHAGAQLTETDRCSSCGLRSYVMNGVWRVDPSLVQGVDLFTMLPFPVLPIASHKLVSALDRMGCENYGLAHIHAQVQDVVPTLVGDPFEY